MPPKKRDPTPSKEKKETGAVPKKKTEKAAPKSKKNEVANGDEKEVVETKKIAEKNITKQKAETKEKATGKKPKEDVENEEKLEEQPNPKKRGVKKTTVVNDTQNAAEDETLEEPQPNSRKRGAKKTTEVEPENQNIEDSEPPSKQSRKPREAPKKKVKTEVKKVEPKREASRMRGKKEEEKTKEKKARGKKDEEKVEVAKPTKTKKTATSSSTAESSAEDTKKNETVTKWSSLNFITDKVNEGGESPNFKITSWNIGGLRAWLKKDGLSILEYDSPDIFCMQEIRCTKEDMDGMDQVEGYELYYCVSDKKGYAGVGLLTKIKPIEIFYGIEDEEQDKDGRCITAEYEKFFLVNVYVPNAGRGLVTLEKRLDWNVAFKTFIKNLDEKKPVIICGDMNVAHNEIDLKNPKTNHKHAGFTNEEREGMTDFIESGFVDTFRQLYPDKTDVYTFWTYMANARKKNVGWRLDYFLVSNRFMSKICDHTVLDQVFGSDHCPITLFMNI